MVLSNDCAYIGNCMRTTPISFNVFEMFWFQVKFIVVLYVPTNPYFAEQR